MLQVVIQTKVVVGTKAVKVAGTKDSVKATTPVAVMVAILILEATSIIISGVEIMVMVCFDKEIFVGL